MSVCFFRSPTTFFLRAVIISFEWIKTKKKRFKWKNVQFINECGCNRWISCNKNMERMSIKAHEEMHSKDEMTMQQQQHDNNNNTWKKNWLNTSWCISSWTCAYFGDNDMSASSSAPFFACFDDDLNTESLIIAHFVTEIQMADRRNSSRSLLQLLSELICPCVTGFNDIYREKYINYGFSCQEPGTVCNAKARRL